MTEDKDWVIWRDAPTVVQRVSGPNAVQIAGTSANPHDEYGLAVTKAIVAAAMQIISDGRAARAAIRAEGDTPPPMPVSMQRDLFDSAPTASRVSDLADRILALINSKPRTPTKAEIEEVLTGHLDAAVRMMEDAALLSSFPRFLTRTDDANRERHPMLSTGGSGSKSITHGDLIAVVVDMAGGGGGGLSTGGGGGAGSLARYGMAGGSPNVGINDTIRGGSACPHNGLAFDVLRDAYVCRCGHIVDRLSAT